MRSGHNAFNGVFHLVILFATVGHVLARAPPCDRGRRLHQGETVDGQGITYPNGTLVRTLDLGHIQQECIITFNSYFNPYSEGSFEVQAPEGNLQVRADNCCAICHSKDACNAWQWCPEPEGCVIPAFNDANGNPVPNSNRVFPYRGCQLLSLVEFSPSYQNISSIRVRGYNVAFVAGTPFGLNIPKVAGYELELGADFNGRYNYNCTMSKKPDVCMVSGDAETLAKLCNDDSRCMGYSYQALGIPEMDYDGPVGFLKTRTDGGILTVNDTDLNPTSSVFIKISTLAKPLIGEAVDKENDKVRTTILVACVVVGTLALIAGIAGFVYYKRYRRMSRAAPSKYHGNGAMLDEGVSTSGSLNSDQMDRHKDLILSLNPVPETSPAVFDSASSQSALSMQPGSNELVSPFMLLDQNTIQAMMAAAPHVVTVLPEDKRRAEPGPNPGAMLSLDPGQSSGSQQASPELSSSPTTSEFPPGEGIGGIQAGASSGGARMLDPKQQNSSTARELMDALSRTYRTSANIDYAQLTRELEGMEDIDEGKEGLSRNIDNNSNPDGGAVVAGIGREGGSASGPPSGSSEDDWAIKMESVEICKRMDGSWWLLGTGACGTVYKGFLDNEVPVAVKVLHITQDARHTANFTREITLLKSLRNRHVVKFLGACLDGKSAMLVTELMELGDLWRALPLESREGGRIFSWYNRGHRVMLDVAKGLQYLHGRRIVHLDLKSANILLNRKGSAKIADIGMAKVLNKSYLSILSGLGTFAWSAPELLTNKRCDEKVDIYSLGVVLWEVCTGSAPVRGDMRPLQAPEECPQEVADLYLRCIQEEPEARPTATEIVELLSALSGKT